jgi:excisionase family DNA binding protein
VPELPPEDRVLTPAEAAAVLKVDTSTLRRFEDQGKLTSGRTVGGHRRYWEQDVRALAAERARIAAAEEEETMGADEVASLFAVKRSAVLQWAREGKIPSAWSRGHRRRFPVEAVRALLEGDGEGDD